ncbi:MAG: dinitrogenase iron-molybdenum cofactor biosynthesis protein [Epsilonproteobacteria bacterium]|nr:dinitrogenase iron-molybdenum cofactor biosynthesis protein [Campylobacterota bacterium]
MKILFTAKGENWDSEVDPRFGRAEMFVLYDEDSNTLKVISNDEAKEKAHGVGLQSAKMVLETGADVVITGNGAGEKAAQILQNSNVEIFVGAGGMSLKEAYEAYKNSKLKKQF